LQQKVAVIGGGLAGSEVTWKLAQNGIGVTVFEMKPAKFSPAHNDDKLGELVCSNSFRSDMLFSGVGLLKQEMRKAKSLVMQAAEETRVPAGKALAVDRERFAEYVTRALQELPEVEIVRQEISGIDDPVLNDYSSVVIATGPLCSDSLTDSILNVIGNQELYFYDAIAPIVSADSIDWDKVFFASRYDPESSDYLNCPLNEEEYYRLRQALLTGERVNPESFESEKHFEGCLPVETLAERGEMTLAFGPLKPVGLEDPGTGETPFAVVQLRAENLEKTMFNLVGFQTKLTYRAQKEAFTLIPGLENANFLRLGSIHRNTYINSPQALTPYLEIKNRPGIYLAGQITGVEGYVESAACGLWLGLYLAGKYKDVQVDLPPEDTALGGLLKHLRTPAKDFQPMNVNFGLLPPLNQKAKKRRRKELYVQRAEQSWQQWWENQVSGLAL